MLGSVLIFDLLNRSDVINWKIKALLKFVTSCLYIGLLLETCYTCTVLTWIGGVITPNCIVSRNHADSDSVSEAAKIFIRNLVSLIQ